MIQVNARMVLPELNIFNYRDTAVTEEKVIQKMQEITSCFSRYNVRLISATLSHNVDTRAELNKSRLTTMVLVFQKTKTSINEETGEQIITTEDVEYKYLIPWPKKGRHYIGGNYKVVLYQLCDHPILVKKDSFMVRTNILSLTVTVNPSYDYKYNLQLYGAKIPFVYILYVYLGEQALKQRFQIDDSCVYTGTENPETTNTEARLVPDIIRFLTNDPTNRNKLFSVTKKADQKTVVDDLLLITDVDVFTKKFFKTDNIIEELLYAMSPAVFDDTNYENKRLRYEEQWLYSLLIKDMYNILLAFKSGKTERHNNNSQVLLTSENGISKSDAAQYAFDLNPVSVLGVYGRTTLTGIDGLKKETVPNHLKALYISSKGRLCPCDTGDRENCGTVLHLIPTINISQYLNMADMMAPPEDCCSTPILFVPFAEHDDPTRLQMASSHIRHFINLLKFHVPYVQSGYERTFSKYTVDILIAEHDGIVIHRDEDSIVIRYNNGVCESFYTGYRKLYLGTCDFSHTYFNEGDTFRTGDIISESNFFRDGRIVFGVNQTAIFACWRGWNFEDGIVLNRATVESGVYDSIHCTDYVLDVAPHQYLCNLNNDLDSYKILPKRGDKLRAGDVFAIVHRISGENCHMIHQTPIEHVVEQDCEVVDIKVYVNGVCEEMPQYAHDISERVNAQMEKTRAREESMLRHITVDELSLYNESVSVHTSDKDGKRSYRVKGEKIEGLQIRMTVMYVHRLAVGDKLANRHGNKGIVAAIVDSEKMPYVNGKPVDLVFNYNGVPSRMNIGQLFEMPVALIAKTFIERASECTEENYNDLRNELFSIIELLDGSENRDNFYLSQYIEQLGQLDCESFKKEMETFYFVQPIWENASRDAVILAMERCGLDFEYSTIDGVTGKAFGQNISYGSMYVGVLNHIAEEKLAARGVGPYGSKVGQPLEGSANHGGQRLGEMEVWALAGHGAEANLREMMTTKSDSVKLRNSHIANSMGIDPNSLDIENDDDVPQSLRLLQWYLRMVGVDILTKKV